MTGLFSKIKNKKSKDDLAKMLECCPELSRSDAEMKIEDVTSKYSISRSFYLNEELYRLNNKMLKIYLDGIKARARIDYIARRYDLTAAEVYLTTRELLNKHSLTRQYVVINDVFDDLSPENIEFHKKKRLAKQAKVLQELADITGMTLDEVKTYVDDIKDRFNVGVFEIKKHQLFKYNNEQIAEILADQKKKNLEIAELIKAETGWSDYELYMDRLDAHRKYGISKIDTYYDMEYWRLSDEIRDSYAVKKDADDLCDLYNTTSTKVLDDKALFDKTYTRFLRRKYWINRDTSIEEFKTFIDGLDAVFCKPINLLGGHGAYRYTLNKDIQEMYEYFMNEPKMLVEEIPKQHPVINNIYDGCIDTVRLMTALKDGKFYAFAAWIKFGAGGSIVDGRFDGGMYAGVDEETGEVITKALCVGNERVECHPDTGAKILGLKIPYWDEVRNMAEEALRLVDGIDFVGWDFVICEDGPAIIEGNAHPAFSSYQLLFTDERIGMKHKYAFLLDK